ncbi:MAG: hypothetical protein ACLSD6_07130 [Clostridium sp.]
MYVTMKMQAEQMDFSKEGNGICVKTQYSLENRCQRRFDILMDGKCVDKHAFIGMMKFDKGMSLRKTELFGFSFGGFIFRISSLSAVHGILKSYTVYKGREIAVNKAKQSFGSKSVFVSPYQIVVFTRDGACTADCIV